jgi:hypothetical protein
VIVSNKHLGSFGFDPVTVLTVAGGLMDIFSPKKAAPVVYQPPPPPAGPSPTTIALAAGGVAALGLIVYLARR